MIEQQIKDIIEESMNFEGYGIYRIKYAPSKTMGNLQIMIEKLNNTSIGIEDCEKVSILVSTLLDVHDPIEEQYNLEVSSPGIDRPLMTLEHYKYFVGHKVKVQTINPVEKSKNITGEISKIEDNIIIIIKGNITYNVEFNNILSGKLSLTDKLMNFMQQEETKEINND